MQLSRPPTRSALSCAREVLDTVPPVIWFIRRQMRSHRKGLSLGQFRALCRVDQEPTAGLSAVAEHLGSSLSATSRMIAGLVKRELLSRSDVSKDRRRMALVITPRGRAMLDEAWRAAQNQMAEDFLGLTGAQHACMVEAMTILKTMYGSVGLPQRIGDGRNGESPARSAKKALAPR